MDLKVPRKNINFNQVLNVEWLLAVLPQPTSYVRGPDAITVA